MAILQLSAPAESILTWPRAACQAVTTASASVRRRRILTNVFLAREISQNSGGLTFVREISVLQGNATSRKQERWRFQPIREW